MLNLIHNENMKLYYRKSTLAMIISLIVMTVFFAVVARIYDFAPALSNTWDAMGGEVWLLFIVNVFTLIVASGMVANEFSWGTIKFLLIRPVSRSRILLSKYIALVIYSLLLTAIVFSFSFMINALLYSPNPNIVHLSTSEGERAVIHNTFNGILKIFVLKHIEVFIYGTIGFMFSVLSRNTAFAIGSSLIIIFLGPLLGQYLPGKYMLFSNLNLTNYTDRVGNVDVVGLIFAIKTLFAYFLSFVLISWRVFIKCDVEN